LFEVAYETTFCATHVLHRDGQPIEPQHGHDWRVEVVARGETLDGLGVVVDFEHLKQAVAGISARFHYGDITSHPDFAGQVRRPKRSRATSSARCAKRSDRRASGSAACASSKPPAAARATPSEARSFDFP
jgi:6-pyruvoyl-tetrahydropterin synthase